MVGYMNLEERVDRDLERARRLSLLWRVVAWLQRESGRVAMTSFDSCRRKVGADNRVHLGQRVVEVSRVVGSVGRYREFDCGFMPTTASVERWRRVDRAFHCGLDLPPVTLYEINGGYFVQDGNHRVSVARFQGVQWIEADVIRFSPRVKP